MDSLRIDNGMRQIEVNDAGETVEFSVVDNNFLKAYFDLVRWFTEQEKRAEIKEMEKHADKVISDDGENINYDAVDGVLDIREKICQEACEKINNIFDPEASRKLFGKVTPDMYMIADFFDKFTPLAEKYDKERKQAINKKYSKNRKGAKS